MAKWVTLWFFLTLLFITCTAETATLSQRSFSGGELTPSLYGRIGLEKYRSGLRTMRNFYTKKHGGATNRPGTKYIGLASYAEKNTRLIPFKFSDTTTYMIELGSHYARFIRDDGYVTEDAYTILGIASTTNPEIEVTDHGFIKGDWVYLSSLEGMVELEGRTVSVSRVIDSNNFEVVAIAPNEYHTPSDVSIDATDYTEFVPGTGTAARIYTLSMEDIGLNENDEFGTEDNNDNGWDHTHLFDLRFVQSGDVMTFASSSYQPRELTRLADDSWTIDNISFIPTTSTPSELNVAGAGSGTGNEYWYQVTAYDDELKEESLPIREMFYNGNDANSNAHTLTWTKVPGIETYYVYRERSGTAGFMATVTTQGTFETVSYVNNSAIGAVEDYTDTPPTGRDPFDEASEYPHAVTYIQQRLSFGGSASYPERIHMSRSGRYKNFSTTIPTQDDDAIDFTLVGRVNNSIEHMLDLGRMIVFTSGGEWSIGGDAAGNIKPEDINARQQTYNGSGDVPPLVINDTAVYLQERGSIVRDLQYNFNTDGYTGDDLSIFSSHLFENYEIIEWDYEQVPDSIIWAVRNDGKLLSLTYNRAQDMLAWSRHDFVTGMPDVDGSVKSLGVIPDPDGNEDALYLIINRSIDGTTRPYIEKMVSRRLPSIEDAKFMDSHLSIDGRNTNTSNTVSLTTSAGSWDYDDTIGLTANHAAFSSSDVGKEIHLTGSDGTFIRFAINAFIDTSSVSGKPDKTVTTPMRNVSISDWKRAVKVVTNLWHLEGVSLSVIGDGSVEGSPNNPDYSVYKVTNGSIELDSAYSVIHAGLPYFSDLETLDLNNAEGESLADRKMKVDSVNMYVESTRGLWVGNKAPTSDPDDALEDLNEPRLDISKSLDPIGLITDDIKQSIKPEWNGNGRVFLRQVEPLPATILTIEPNGWFPIRR
jgi:hypothetical protein